MPTPDQDRGAEHRGDLDRVDLQDEEHEHRREDDEREIGREIRLRYQIGNIGH